METTFAREQLAGDAATSPSLASAGTLSAPTRPRRRMRVAHTAALTAALLSAACGGASGGGAPRVGIVLPLSGDQVAYGSEAWNGMQLALEDLAAGGLELEVLLKDDASDKRTAGRLAKLLIESSDAVALVGSLASGNTLQMSIEARESGVPLLSPSSTSDTLTEEGGHFVFRVCFADSFQGTVLARFARSAGWTRAAVLVDRANVYSTGLADSFVEAFEAEGGEAGRVYYKTGDGDYAPVIQAVLREAPDVIVFCGYYGQGGPLIRQAGERWSDVPVLGGDGLDSPGLADLVGEARTEIYVSTHFAADAPDEAIQSFVARYVERFGVEPGAQAALGFDAILVLGNALRRCGDPEDGEALARALAETRGLRGVTGTLSLDTPDRTPVKDAVIVSLVGGRRRYHDTVEAP